MVSKTTSENQFSDLDLSWAGSLLGSAYTLLLAPNKAQVFEILYGSVIHLKILNTVKVKNSFC